MKRVLLILPHQLFVHHPGLSFHPDEILLIEDPLFFGDTVYPAAFHKQKLWLHMASMAQYRALLEKQGHRVRTLAYDAHANDLQAGLDQAQEVLLADPVDFIALKRIRKAAKGRLKLLSTPGFVNSDAENQQQTQGRWFMADYYKRQRRRLDILMEGDAPKGGKWSFDEDNRKKVPKALLNAIPSLPQPAYDDTDMAAKRRVISDFPQAPGRLNSLYLPTTHSAAESWLRDFLRQRLPRFGDYEDAIVAGENTLWHSVLTPMLNIGLLTPAQVIEETLEHAERFDVPLNALEGFIRQIIGWREFMRASYTELGVKMRTSNHWNHTRPMPHAFYDATTGLPPVDDAIGRVLETGYCHHIERLMVLGGIMFLCEISPDAIYRWFMELFVDSYDWVMVPNVYAMSQHADGGLITTKPYFSGSNYIRKMSHYPKGDWAEIWDGLYWRFILKHCDVLQRNPRWAMMCRMAQKMDSDVQAHHISTAEEFLAKLSP